MSNLARTGLSRSGSPRGATSFKSRASDTALLGRRPWLVGEFLIFFGLLFLYDRIRSVAPLRIDAAVAHGFAVLRLEGPLAWERTVNHWFADNDLLGAASVGYYQFLHLTSALVVLVWCYVAKPTLYRPIRNALIAVNVVGFIVFALYPVAPPRLLPGTQYLDLVALAGYGTEHGPLPMNAYAAMPSLHLAWAVCIAMVGLSASRRLPVRALFVAHPVLTGVIVVATANHYLLDIAAGVGLGVLASVMAGLRFRPGATQPGTRALALHGTPAAASAAAGSGGESDPNGDDRRFTLVSFHAHPDDETLFTGGTLARAAAEGHRVVVVVATLGDAGLTGAVGGGDDTVAVSCGDDLGEMRRRELSHAVAELGAARWEWLGYADSGRFGDEAGTGDRPTFVNADPDEAAERLAAILRSENADVLTTYDSAGGYGHPDHVRVHEVGAAAARLAGTPTVLEATVDRRRALWLARILRFIPRLPGELRPDAVARSFAPSDRLTHRIDVRGYIDHKRAAMRAHTSQRSGGAGPRSLAIYLRLPRRAFTRMFGTEWFVERGREPALPLLDTVFATNQERIATRGNLAGDPVAHVATDDSSHWVGAVR